MNQTSFLKLLLVKCERQPIILVFNLRTFCGIVLGLEHEPYENKNEKFLFKCTYSLHSN